VNGYKFSHDSAFPFRQILEGRRALAPQFCLMGEYVCGTNQPGPAAIADRTLLIVPTFDSDIIRA
jgi:hypothetical protein